MRFSAPGNKDHLALTMARNYPLPGDIYAIPRPDGGFYFVIHIAANRFGDAFGLFAGHFADAGIDPSWKPAPMSLPVHTGRALIANGRWIRIGRRKDLLPLFPASPEIYHSKADNPHNSDIGRFGAAETADSQLRQLTESEAKKVGLYSGSYRQIMLEEEFERHLETINE